MENDRIQQDISLIKEMIEKTRREAADSGHFFIYLGIGAIIYVVVIMTLNLIGLNHLALPAMIIMTVIMGALGFYITNRDEKKEKVKSYPKTICYIVLAGCSIPIIILTFLFPLTGVYSFALVPTFAAMFFGTMLFSTAAIYEFSFLYWSALVAWGGGIAMVYMKGPIGGVIMIAILIIGFVIPGTILNRKYKNGSK